MHIQKITNQYWLRKSRSKICFSGNISRWVSLVTWETSILPGGLILSTLIGYANVSQLDTVLQRKTL